MSSSKKKNTDTLLCIAVGGAALIGLAYALRKEITNPFVKTEDEVKENFAMLPKMMSVPADVWERDAAKSEYLPKLENRPYDTMFIGRPDGKAPISPRFQNFNVGSTIRGSQPPSHMMASGPEPVPNNHHELITQAYATGDRRNFAEQQVLQHMSQQEYDAMYDDYVEKQRSRQEMLSTEDLLPTASMDDGIGETAFGQNIADPNSFITDNHITVLQKHRNNVGDPFRGDLPIRPNKNGWFDSALGRSAASVLRPGYFSSAIGSPIESESDALDTTVISQRNVEARQGVLYQRLQ